NQELFSPLLELVQIRRPELLDLRERLAGFDGVDGGLVLKQVLNFFEREPVRIEALQRQRQRDAEVHRHERAAVGHGQVNTATGCVLEYARFGRESDRHESHTGQTASIQFASEFDVVDIG